MQLSISSDAYFFGQSNASVIQKNEKENEKEKFL